jgi:hypothetical protein
MGIDPQSLGYFTIIICKLRWEERNLTNAEYEAAVTAAKAEPEGIESEKTSTITISEKQNLWDAQKVDEDSFKKYGIMFGVG